jgi:ferric-dicitrate binding protein FerR (iron transport regulator)
MISYSELAGRALRDHVWSSEDPADEAVERARLVTAATSPGKRRKAAWVAVLSVAVALTVALVVYVSPSTTPPVITFTIGADDGVGEVGVYYAAPPELALPIVFSDGSAVVVQPRGGVRVQRADASHVALFLETGRARFDVNPRSGATWQISAGPYTVKLTGTSFDLTWSAVNTTFELVMHSGSVSVRGPGIESGIVVKDKRRFTSRVTTDLSRPASSATASAGESASAGADRTAPGADADPDSESSDPERKAGLDRRGTNPSSKEPAASWITLAAKGDYAEIVRAAEKQGLEAAISSVNVDELRALADAARFTGRTELAQRTLLAIRSRFPRTKAATAAAFIIGRLRDGAGDPRSAVTWYDRYLAEGGPLAAEAQGRRMIALDRIGNREGSRKAAHDYVRRFPDGPYIQQARDLESR